MRRCSVQATPATCIAHRQPTRPLDKTPQNYHQRRRQGTIRQTPPFCSPAKLIHTGPGPRPSGRGQSAGPSQRSTIPPTHRRRARTSRPRPSRRSPQPDSPGERAVVRCHGLYWVLLRNCSPTPARRSTRDSAYGSTQLHLPIPAWARLARHHEQVTNWHARQLDTAR